MNILFLHRDFPGQFKYLIWALTKIPNCKVFFITEDQNSQLEDVEKLVYKVPHQKENLSDSFIGRYEFIISHAKAVAEVAKGLRDRGIRPDVIYGFNAWGLGLFMKDIFPDVPLISYCEWFFNSKGADFGFDGRTYTDEVREEIRLKNSHMLVDLCAADYCVSPTQWQKDQFPKEFHDKIRVLHDGVSADIFKPDKDAKFLVPNTNIELGVEDEVITYATRGMELYRGFPQFMEAAEVILKKRPNAHVVVAGVDDAYYGPKLRDMTYKEYMLESLNLDMSRIHFVGMLPTSEYIKLLQVSSVHVYLTFPFILSWSFIEAMSTGCCMVASNTQPVLEVMKDNYNGLLTDFYGRDGLVEKIEYALENPEKMQIIRNNARQTIIDNYEIRTILPKHIEYINNLFLKNQAVV